MHGLDFGSYLPRTETPILATLHLPPSWYPPEVFERGKDLFLTCVSGAQRLACPPEARLLADVPNGVPVPPLSAEPRKNYALSLGRICPEKGFHLAVRAAKRAGVPFLLAGKIFDYPDHLEYFRRELGPLLDDRAEYVGEVHGLCKQKLLGEARCVLVPSLVAETCSLVALEAMAAGTPVIAFPSGALADVVVDGKTGFLVRNEDEMSQALGRVGEISPEACREHVEKNFSEGRMTDRYLGLYRSLARTSVPVRGATVHVEVLREDRELDALLPEWNELFREAAHATPFQSPAWLRPWWDAFRNGDLTAIAVRDGGKLVGFAPLYIMGRTVRFAGVSLSDYSDILAAPGWEQVVADAVVEQLSAIESEWDWCDFDELGEDSPLLLARIPARYGVTVTESSICPQISLAEYELPAKQRRNVSNSRHRLERAFPGACFERIGRDGCDLFIRSLIELHGARWAERSEPGLLADDPVVRFHRSAIPQIEEQGLARLFALRAGDRILSALYCLADARALYYYMIGFDPSLERMGPGTLLIDHAIGEAKREQLSTLDFLRGAEAYKYTWGAINRRNRRLTIRSCPAPQPTAG